MGLPLFLEGNMMALMMMIIMIIMIMYHYVSYKDLLELYGGAGLDI